jgi:protein transport protein SEC61 subunit gamma-like protein
VKLFKRKEKVPDDRSFMEKAWDLQHRLEVRQKRVGKGKYGRVLKMARKPTSDEYAKTSKITGAGIMLIGGLGFLIFLIANQVAPWVAEMLGL